MLRPSQKRVAGLPAIPRKGEIKHAETLKYYAGVRAERKAREDARLTAEIKAFIKLDDGYSVKRVPHSAMCIVDNSTGAAIQFPTHVEFYLPIPGDPYGSFQRVDEDAFCQGFKFVA